MEQKPTPLTGAKNIGRTIEKRLNEIGVFSLDDLALMTPVEAYKAICNRYPDKTIPICYYLYSLQGALLDMQWDALPTHMKTDLRKAVGR